MMNHLYCCLFLIITFISTNIAQVAEVSLVLGNPSSATQDINQPENYLLVHSGYVLSYNKLRGGANWVTWHLSKSDLGDAERSNAFAPDTMLPRNWWIRPTDYARSGYDQGHMCPSEDRTETAESNKETFLMSNMLPQVDRLNRVTWRSLEAYTQRTIRAGNEAYIYAGCYGEQGRIKDKITVPTNCYKIVVVLPEGNNDLRRIDENTEIIAVDMPNEKTIKNRWQSYRTTVDDIESKTGYDFLSTLPETIQSTIENRKLTR